MWIGNVCWRGKWVCVGDQAQLVRLDRFVEKRGANGGRVRARTLTSQLQWHACAVPCRRFLAATPLPHTVTPYPWLLITLRRTPQGAAAARAAGGSVRGPGRGGAARGAGGQGRMH